MRLGLYCYFGYESGQVGAVNAAAAADIVTEDELFLVQTSRAGLYISTPKQEKQEYEIPRICLTQWIVFVF